MYSTRDQGPEKSGKFPHFKLKYDRAKLLKTKVFSLSNPPAFFVCCPTLAMEVAMPVDECLAWPDPNLNWPSDKCLSCLVFNLFINTQHIWTKPGFALESHKFAWIACNKSTRTKIRNCGIWQVYFKRQMSKKPGRLSVNFHFNGVYEWCLGNQSDESDMHPSMFVKSQIRIAHVKLVKGLLGEGKLAGAI